MGRNCSQLTACFSPTQLPEPYRRSFPKEAVRHEHKKKHKHKKLEVKKHEAAAAAAAAEQPHPSTLESSSTSVDSHIPSGHLISGVGIGQVITSSQSSGMKSLSGMYMCVYQLFILCAVGTLYTLHTSMCTHTS